MPWPLRFDFMRVEESDGRRRWSCVGYSVGAPISRDEEAPGDPANYELTMERNLLIAGGFLRYRRMAELLLFATDENIAAANRVHQLARRRKGGPWTQEERAILAADYLAYREAPDTMIELESLYGIVRKNLWVQLQYCERDGLIAPGVLKHRMKN